MARFPETKQKTFLRILALMILIGDEMYRRLMSIREGQVLCACVREKTILVWPRGRSLLSLKLPLVISLKTKVAILTEREANALSMLSRTLSSGVELREEDIMIARDAGEILGTDSGTYLIAMFSRFAHRYVG